MLHKFSQILTAVFINMATPSTIDTADMSKDTSMTIFISIIKETMDTSSAARICTLKIMSPIDLSIKWYIFYISLLETS